MGTKKGQIRKTARRAYEPKKKKKKRKGYIKTRNPITMEDIDRILGRRK